jgi:hypothetical protein
LVIAALLVYVSSNEKVCLWWYSLIFSCRHAILWWLWVSSNGIMQNREEKGYWSSTIWLNDSENKNKYV